MKVILWDKMRETYLALEGVTKIESNQSKHHGRYCNFWFVNFEDGSSKAFLQRWFTIDSVEK